MEARIPGLVSIITPAYNCERTIEKTIKSVQRQSYSYWEMIIFDDASTDETAAIVKRLQIADERIQLLRNEKNVRAAASRNACGVLTH